MKKRATNKIKDLQAYREHLSARFDDGEDICSLILSYTNYCNDRLLNAWQCAQLNKEKDISLISLGSLGRGEILPYSDLDLLILLHREPSKRTHKKTERFIQMLWDEGFHLGHQVSTLQDLLNLASNDINVITSLFDIQFLTGDEALFEKLRYEMSPHHLWSSDEFYKAKWQEQLARHQYFNDSAYTLEPNLKNGPGGLRDIQMILWIAHRHFGDTNLSECLSSGLITKREHQTLRQCLHFLLRARFALHQITGKDENRILFNYQYQLAEKMGFKDHSKQNAIEAFMKTYFTVIKSVRELNDILLQLFREIIFAPQKPNVKQLDSIYQTTNQYLEVRNHSLFIESPSNIFKLFIILISHPDIKGIRANTIRFLMTHRYLIDEEFRVNQENTTLFLTLLRKAPDIYNVLQRMNQYGLLSLYIPEFGSIIGQMQYDLFHAYTVDQHALFVIRHIMRFKEENHLYPLCHEIYDTLEKKELLIIAALFHDIAKGRGGCHSTLGAIDAKHFCKRHHLSSDDTDLVVWLVKHHLIFSHTAQRKDIYESGTIETFCRQVKTQPYLNYLYLLTVADICATNPTLWNSWKASLFKTLFIKSTDFFNEQQQFDEDALIAKRQKEALTYLDTFESDKVKSFWNTLKKRYFLHTAPEDIAHHTEAIIQANAFPLVNVYHVKESNLIKLFIFAKHIEQRVYITTTLISNHHFNIVEARIMKTSNDFDLDVYTLLYSNKQIANEANLDRLQKSLVHYLTFSKRPKTIRAFLPRRQRHVQINPKIIFTNDHIRQRTTLMVVATDRKGLLSEFASVFNEYSIQLLNAKIITTGEQVEDTFILTTFDNKPLDDNQQALLEQALLNTLKLPVY